MGRSLRRVIERFKRVAVGVLIVSVAVACSGEADSETTTTSTTVAPSTTATSTSTTTTSTSTTTTTTTLALPVPDEWVEVAPDEFELPALAGGLEPTLVSTEMMGEGSIDDAANEATVAREEIVREFEVLSSGSRQIGERNARFLEYAGVDQGNIARYEVWVDMDGSVLHVTYAASVEAYSRSKADFEQFLTDLVG